LFCRVKSYAILEASGFFSKNDKINLNRTVVIMTLKEELIAISTAKMGFEEIMKNELL